MSIHLFQRGIMMNYIIKIQIRESKNCLLKEPRSTLSWHRDPEPRLAYSYNIQIQVAIMVIDNVAKHMPADGSVWITNNTKYHNAFNGGEENRVHLVACVLDYKFN